MTFDKIFTFADRIALSLMNSLVVVALPLVAIGLLTQAL